MSPNASGALAVLDIGASVDKESLDLLQEARDYLLALPRHPLTQDLARRIDAHLQDPTVARAQAVSQRVTELESKRSVQMSNVWGLTSTGIASLVVSLAGDELEIQSPRASLLAGSSSGKQFAFGLAKNLAAGIQIKLEHGPFWALNLNKQK